jgi:hypothetical protein
MAAMKTAFVKRKRWWIAGAGLVTLFAAGAACVWFARIPDDETLRQMLVGDWIDDVSGATNRGLQFDYSGTMRYTLYEGGQILPPPPLTLKGGGRQHTGYWRIDQKQLIVSPMRQASKDWDFPMGRVVFNGNNHLLLYRDASLDFGSVSAAWKSINQFLLSVPVKYRRHDPTTPVSLSPEGDNQ